MNKIEKFEKACCEDTRTGNTPDVLAKAFLDNLTFVLGTNLINASKNDLYLALSYTVRDRMLSLWNQEYAYIQELKQGKDLKVVSYLSAEFLPGPHLGNNLVSLKLYDQVKTALETFAIDIDELIETEEEPGLGNGGLGRLASCFMDSLATINIPAYGYGIRYEFGIFDQEIHQGWQAELTDKWLRHGNPWEIAKLDFEQTIKLGGHTVSTKDKDGNYKSEWLPAKEIKGIPYDTPILGYGGTMCNSMRLWKAEAVKSFDFNHFNSGDYYAAVDEKISSETITKVLYPNDETDAGKSLRLIQQYFFVSCSLQDMIRIHFIINHDLSTFHEHFAIQLNDTHPSIAVAELMRLLIDVYGMDWEKAWHITTRALSYTNHTLLPEALEKWSLPLFQSILPRHVEIIFEINARFMSLCFEKFPNDLAKISRLSIIDESGSKYIRMANLACVGSHHINGVAALHSELLKEHVLHDFFNLWPNKFLNVTNGVTPRRWVALSNKALTKLITNKIGDNWIRNYQEEIRKIEPLANDPAFCQEWADIKYNNKVRLATWIKKETDIDVDPNSIFDIQVKRIHEYKRQHLNALHIIALYNRLKANPNLNVPSRTFIFGGKAAPGYFMAKRIIKLINSIGDVVNNDPEIKGKIKVVFLPNFNVQTGHFVYPASDLSEQISTAGKEASGTGNMKFAMNGALTIGTLDGANVEIRDEVGHDNFFLFGLTTEQVYHMKSRGYDAAYYYHNDQELKLALDQIANGYYSNGDTQIFKPLVDSLLYHDEYMLLADFRSYIECQDKVDKTYLNKDKWVKMSILNVARMGKFSSDRSIKDYSDKIWGTSQVEL